MTDGIWTMDRLSYKCDVYKLNVLSEDMKAKLWRNAPLAFITLSAPRVFALNLVPVTREYFVFYCSFKTGASYISFILFKSYIPYSMLAI